MNNDFEDELCHLMATDEIGIYEGLTLAEELEAFYEAFETRRAKLSEIDKKRIEKLAYNHREIQAIFERLEIPFKMKQAVK